MLAGVPVTADSTAELAGIVRAAGADLLADRLEKALADEVKLLACRSDERAITLRQLEPARRAHRAPRSAPERAPVAAADGTRSVSPPATDPPVGSRRRALRCLMVRR